MIPDVNVVVAAARDDHLHHTVAKQWWLDALQTASARNPIRLLPVVVSGFLRIVTHPKVFASPSTIEAAAAHIDALLALPNVVYASADSDWATFRKLCVEKSLSGNAIPDAWIAACAIQSGDALVTFDKDFRKLLSRSQVVVLRA
ncbi:MAG: PIN domain-containing protein [Burkholderiales bacterium]|nr:PIN domain-containing protein [Burkholderiales bacterium]